jgi:hypothetical protein
MERSFGARKNSPKPVDPLSLRIMNTRHFSNIHWFEES